eukprot:GHVN01080361.1.p1 GENE.GHVN01080361.1~~GHVN01080361.1.p1  ORF type:complete len:507 (-),score=31.64 GHVN01080361.1:70-1422(-)
MADPLLVASAFSRHFQSVFTPITHCNEDMSVLPPPALTSIPLLVPDRVKALIGSLKPKTSSGPDGIPPLMVKRIADALAEPLCLFYNASILHTYVPPDWKRSDVTPVFKDKGSPSHPSSYRLISLCSVFSKMIERHVYDLLLAYLERTSRLNLQQHGCRWGVSTVTNLLLAIDAAFRAKDNSLSFEGTFLDFAKAFDKVSHPHLMYKLRLLGIGGDLMMWIASWLLDRRRRVNVCGCYSDWVEVTSSVPQGTVLGPLLFIIYVADLCVDLSSGAFQFVDNAKVLSVVQSCADVLLAQEDLDKISLWCQRWLMQLNPRECVVMNLSPPIPAQQLIVGGTPLHRVSSIRDLGCHYDTQLKFNSHVDKTIQKARGRIQRFKQIFRSRHGDVVLPHYLRFLRPLLEYAIPVWWGVCDTYRSRVERVQRSFLRLIFALYSPGRGAGSCVDGDFSL